MATRLGLFANPQLMRGDEFSGYTEPSGPTLPESRMSAGQEWAGSADGERSISDKMKEFFGLGEYSSPDNPRGGFSESMSGIGDKFSSFGKSISENPELASMIAKSIGDIGKRKIQSRIAEAQVATSPFVKNDLLKLANQGALGADLVSDLAEGLALQKNRERRDRQISALEGISKGFQDYNQRQQSNRDRLSKL